MTEAERFWLYVDMSGDCWLWTGAKTPYGVFTLAISRVSIGAHVYAYELVNGPVPAGLELDHLCRNPPCVRPSHLEAVTGRINTLRGNTITALNAAKTACPRGHAYSGTDYSGRRICHPCQAENQRRYRERQEAVA